MPVKAQINVQDHFLNQARREKVKLIVSLTNGDKVEGFIKSFDNYCCVVEEAGGIHLIYKHAIATVSPLIPDKMKSLISFQEK